MKKKTPSRPPVNHTLHKGFLFGVLLFLLGFLLFFFSSFLTTLFIAAILVITVYPLQKFFLTSWKLPPSLAAFLTLVLLVIFFVLPFGTLSYFLFQNASFIFEHLNDSLSSLQFQNLSFSQLDQYPVLRLFFDDVFRSFSSQDILTYLENFLGQTAGALLQYTSSFLKNVSLFILHFFVFFLALFYFLRDGKTFISYVQSLLPVSEENQERLLTRMYSLMRSITLGLLAAALAQGATFFLGLLIAGVPNPLFWAALGALLSPLPYIGVALIWVPISIFLFINGDHASATFLLVWCVVIVSNIDNLVKPYILGRSALLHPFAVMLALLGGAISFGFTGLLFGPFLLLLSVSFLEIYRSEFRPFLSKRKNAPLPFFTRREISKRKTRLSRVSKKRANAS